MLRLVRRVAEGGCGTTTTATRASMVVELTGDEKVVAVFEVPTAVKEWNW